MTQQEASLLALPDELLVQIFGVLAQRFGGRDNPLVPLLSVCRRVHAVAKPVLYRNVELTTRSVATAFFETAVQRDPSIGRLVDNLTIYGIDHFGAPEFPCSRAGQATICALTQLKKLRLLQVTIEEVAAVLAALASPFVRYLDIRLSSADAGIERQDLWAHLFRLSELRVLGFVDRAGAAELDLRRKAHSVHDGTLPVHDGTLPQLVELNVTDSVLVKMFDATRPFRQTVPGLRELYITITQSEHMPTISTYLADAPSSLATLQLSDFFGGGTPIGYFPALPPGLRRLELSAGTFLEAEILAYLPTANLESIKFDIHSSVTDRMLQALTGPDRPARLRHICLDHADAEDVRWIPWSLQECSNLHKDADRLREFNGPYWPEGGTEEGLCRALADANVNGIEVTGSALDCIGWIAAFDTMLTERMMKQALRKDRYDDVIARFGQEFVVARLREQAPNTVRLLCGDTRELEDGVGP